MPIAFKEWAVTVRALSEGEQLVTLRKGGIREENKHFELEHDRFFLYPTFDHQRNDLVRASHHPELRRALEEGVWPDEEPPPRALLQDGGIPQPDRVRIRSWAEVVDHFTVTRGSSTASPLLRLDPRLRGEAPRWKRRHPLHVLLLRVYRIPRPVTVRVRDEYHGCRSWVEIDRDLPFEGTPVMADEEFDRARSRSARSAAEARARPRLIGRIAAAHGAPSSSGSGAAATWSARSRSHGCARRSAPPSCSAGSPGSESPIDPHPGPRPLADIRAAARSGPPRSSPGPGPRPPRGRVLRGREWPRIWRPRPCCWTSAAGP